MVIVCNVIRAGTLEGPELWADGDFEKVFPDGTKAPATFAEYCAFVGLPVLPNKKIEP